VNILLVLVRIAGLTQMPKNDTCETNVWERNLLKVLVSLLENVFCSSNLLYKCIDKYLHEILT